MSGPVVVPLVQALVWLLLVATGAVDKEIGWVPDCDHCHHDHDHCHHDREDCHHDLLNPHVQMLTRHLIDDRCDFMLCSSPRVYVCPFSWIVWPEIHSEVIMPHWYQNRISWQW